MIKLLTILKFLHRTLLKKIKVIKTINEALAVNLVIQAQKTQNLKIEKMKT